MVNFRCRILDYLRDRINGRRPSNASIENGDIMLLTGTNKHGKRRARTGDFITRHDFVFKRGVDWSGPAPKLAPIGAETCPSTNRILTVAKNSVAEKIGLRPFDRIIDVLVPESFNASRINITVQIAGVTLDQATETHKRGKIKVERPPPDAWPGLASSIRESAGVSDAWVHAVLSCLTGDEAGAHASVQQLLARHDPALSRRISSLDAGLVSLAALAAGREVEVTHAVGAMLVELLLDGGHRELANSLLTMSAGGAGESSCSCSSTVNPLLARPAGGGKSTSRNVGMSRGFGADAGVSGGPGGSSGGAGCSSDAMVSGGSSGFGGGSSSAADAGASRV